MADKIFLVFLTVSLFGCSHLSRSSQYEQQTDRLVAESISDFSTVEQASKDILGPHKTNHFEVPREFESKVKKWIRFFSQKDRARFQRFLNRGAKYREVIEDLLEESHLPPELYYLGVIESGYSLHAVSRAGAVGPWQFMRPTGREYGLKINHYVDERRDPIRATEAAAKYLKWLYRRTGSWNLALAAYNAGPGRVRSAVRKGQSRDYWSLTKRRLLPRETREYVAQFIAAKTIGKNLDHFGFHEKAKFEYPDVDLVRVPTRLKIKDIAKISGTPKSQLKLVNPQLRRSMTPMNGKSYNIWVPTEHVGKFRNLFQKLALAKVNKSKLRTAYRKHNVYHIVRRSQTLSGISRKYGLTVQQLKNLNRLRSSRIYVGQRLVVKKRPSYQQLSAAKRKVKRRSKTQYRVRRGDNLSKIAKSFQTTVLRIKQLNNLNSSRIYAGQNLIVTSASGSF